MAAPTTAQLVASIYAASVDEPDWSKVAKIVKKLIVFSLLNTALEPEWPYQIVGSDGTTVTRVPLSALQTFYTWCNNMDSGGMVAQYSEFLS